MLAVVQRAHVVEVLGIDPGARRGADLRAAGVEPAHDDPERDAAARGGRVHEAGAHVVALAASHVSPSRPGSGVVGQLESDAPGIVETGAVEPAFAVTERAGAGVGPAGQGAGGEAAVGDHRSRVAAHFDRG